MSRGVTASVVLMLLAGATELVVFSDGRGPIRIALVLAFLLLAPGWAVLRLAAIEMTLSTRVAVAVALSTGLDMTAASVLLYARLWSSELALTLIVALVVAAALFGLPAARRTIMGLARQARAALSELGRQEPG